MASSLGIRCYNPMQRTKLDVTNTNPPNQVSCLMISSSSSSNKKPKKGRILMSMSHQPNILRSYDKKLKQEQEQEQSIAHEKLDQWMKESVVEIVKNLREAPLLLHVYSKDKTTTEKTVVEEEWPVIVDKWVNKEAQTPEGVIFVEKLSAAEEEEEEEEVVDGLTRAWGVVVQGKGAECGPACYLLKTSRVGPACYFCLVRVKSFRETAKKQLQDCWLFKGK